MKRAQVKAVLQVKAVPEAAVVAVPPVVEGGSSGGGGGGFVANDPPTATDDHVTTRPNVAVTVDVLNNDEDPDGDTLALVWVTASTNGSVVINPDQTVTYTPDSDFNGNDSFIYLMGDGKGGTATTAAS